MAVTYNHFAIHPARADDQDRYVTYEQAAAQTYKAGAPLLLSTGKVQETGTDPAAILGFAMADAADNSWENDAFNLVNPTATVALADIEFRGTFKGTFAAADVGSKFGLVEDGTSGFWVVDRSDTTNTRVIITGTDDGVAVGDIDVPVTFVVLSANRQVI